MKQLWDNEKTQRQRQTALELQAAARERLAARDVEEALAYADIVDNQWHHALVVRIYSPALIAKIAHHRLAWASIRDDALGLRVSVSALGGNHRMTTYRQHKDGELDVKKIVERLVRYGLIRLDDELES